MSITSNLHKELESLPEGVKLVAVSKFHSVDDIMEAYVAGQRIFGESRVQELIPKHEALPKDIEWHFIGHLQTNKVKYITPFIHTIHSIDSFKLLEEVDKSARQTGRIINILLQIHVAQEENKFGFSEEECLEMLSKGEWKALENVQICGLMGMASFTENTEQIRKEYQSLALFFRKLKSKHFSDCQYFKELSMGMSDDYPIAVEEGSTMVRIGTGIFGTRIA